MHINLFLDQKIYTLYQQNLCSNCPTTEIGDEIGGTDLYVNNYIPYILLF